MDSQDGKGLIGLLFAMLVVFLVAWMAMPWLQRAGKSGDETAAIATLKAIHQAQMDYHGGTRMYAGLGKLANQKLIANGITQDSFKSKGYEFYHSASGAGTRWCAVAVPEMQEHATAIGEAARRSGSTYGIDESGTVLQNVAMTACTSGTLDRSGGSPVK